MEHLNSLPKVLLVNNAKCIDGTPVNYKCYLEDVYIVEMKNKSCMIRCGVWDQEICLNQIKEYVKD